MRRSSVVDDLATRLPAGALATDPDVLQGYRRDQAGILTAGMPLAVVFPSHAAEVQEVLRVASRHGVPVVPRGEGTGLSGGANAIDDCLVLNLQRMDEIIEINPSDMTARVQPGVINGTLKAAAADQGLWYAPDPASHEISSIGGNLATNAGGLCCVKYGVTRDSVLALEVVLADGRLTRFGHGTRKDVAGYDLVSLFVGSEGTLGVITEATLRLRPQRSPVSTLVAVFDDTADAGGAIAAIMRSTEPALLEILDRTTLRAVDDHTRMGLDRDAAALLLAQSDVGGEAGETEITAIRSFCEEAGASYVAVSGDVDEAEALLQVRRLAYPALEQKGATLLDDVAVPLSRVAELLTSVEDIALRSGTVIGTFGHAGDGNMHPTVVFDPGDDEEVAAAGRAFDEIVRVAIRLGGTITGEHGVGALKQPHLAGSMDEGARWLHRTIKRALDPGNVLNPGKAVP